jgi:hypothetical protein
VPNGRKRRAASFREFLSISCTSIVACRRHCYFVAPLLNWMTLCAGSKGFRDVSHQDACSVCCWSTGVVIRRAWRPYFRCIRHGRCVMLCTFFILYSYPMPILQTHLSLIVSRWHFMPCSLMHAGPSAPSSSKCTVIANGYNEAKNQELSVSAGVLPCTPPCPAVC